MASSFTGWLITLFGPYRDILRFRGRATRTEILRFMLVGSIVNFALDALVQSFLPRDILHYPFGWRTQPIGYAITVIAWLPMWSLLVRRFHDFDRPAWLAITLLIAIETLAFTKMWWFARPDEPILYIVAGTCVIAAAWVLTLHEPNRGPNRYGPDPRLDTPQPHEPEPARR